MYKYFIGTRVEEGRYGPQSKDMSLSDLLGLFSPVIAPTQYVFPDLTPLVRCIHEQIKAQFDTQFALLFVSLSERQRMRDYNTLYNAWTRAASYDDPVLRNSDWHAVIDKAEDFLVALQQDFPPTLTVSGWAVDSAEPIACAGSQYTEALLFIITARAAREPHTLYRDVTLRGYCRWLRDWVKAYLNEQDGTRLLLAASLGQQARYPAVRVLCPDAIPASPDTFLVNYVRTLKDKPIEHREYSDRFDDGLTSCARATRRKLDALVYEDYHWVMIYTLRDLLYRAERLEAFLTDLEKKGDSVAFDQQRNTTETVQALLRGDYSQPPTLPEEKENSGC
ncbi:hypothetical protein ACIPTP_22125 [Pectobacterium versatile]|uniref:hypothetical protein n=1 Tax=Pectobacterium versatile TaxID=2488639 RepID=UPI0037F4367F